MKLKFLILIGSLIGVSAHAYPEMIRHGYVNCTACHNSPHGGDLLSEYGRELGKELLSRNDSVFAKPEQEKQYLQIKTPAWFEVGASIRFLQAFSESSMASRGQFVIMQMDVDTISKLYEEKLKLYAAVGRFEPSIPEAEWKDFIYTPRLWLQYLENWGGSKVSFLRIGRFMPAYGIKIPEHNFVTRKNLGFNPGQERLAAEATWSDEDYQFTATAMLKRARFSDYIPERGYALQASRVFGKKSRAGVNMYRSTLTQAFVETQQSFEGAFAIIGWNEQVSTLLQVDRTHSEDGKLGFLNFLKLNYEWTQGVQLGVFQQYANAQMERTDPHLEAYGLEFYYFPFPNFNLSGAISKQKDSAELSEYQTKAWIVAHFYL